MLAGRYRSLCKRVLYVPLSLRVASAFSFSFSSSPSVCPPRQKSICSSHRWKGPTPDGMERMDILKDNLLETRIYSGTRILEFTEENKGELSVSLSSALINKLKGLQNNKSVKSMIFVGSSESFLEGYNEAEMSNIDSKLKLMKSCQDLFGNIASSDKNTVAVYSGQFNGTAYGIFSACKYRVGTPSSSFAVTELLQGTLPFGGLAYMLSNSSILYGVEIGRYLAATYSSIEAIDMLQLGLLSHYTAEQMEDTLAVSNQHTNYDLDDVESYQQFHVKSESTRELLDDLHVCSNLDPLDDQVFDQIMLVHPKEGEKIPLNKTWEGTLMKEIDGIYSAFSAESVAEVKKRLMNMKTNWAFITLNRMEVIDEHLLQKWFELTRYAAGKNRNISEVYEKELFLGRCSHNAALSK